MSSPKRSAKNENGQFIAVPLALLKSEKYASLDGWAVKLLMDLMRQYNGRNNGDFTIAWSVLKQHGWRSKATIWRAANELRRVGFIIRTRQGGLHECNLYAVTWHKVDECIHRDTGQHKHAYPAGFKQPGGWRDGDKPLDPPEQKRNARSKCVPSSSECVPTEEALSTHAER